MDRNNSVSDVRLNSLLVDDGLDSLMNVVVDMLSSGGTSKGLCVLSLSNFACILVLTLLGLQALLDMIVIAVIELLMLYSSHVVSVLLWSDLLVLNGLHRSVMMVLMDLAVYDLVDVLVMSTSYVLILDCWIHSLVDGSIVFTILRKETTDCCLCFLHFVSLSYVLRDGDSSCMIEKGDCKRCLWVKKRVRDGILASYTLNFFVVEATATTARHA